MKSTEIIIITSPVVAFFLISFCLGIFAFFTL
jgi:hypothetical protein